MDIIKFILNQINIDVVFTTMFGIGLSLSLKKEKISFSELIRIFFLSFSAAYWLGQVICEYINDANSICSLVRLVLAGFSESIWVGVSALFAHLSENAIVVAKKFFEIWTNKK